VKQWDKVHSDHRGDGVGRTASSVRWPAIEQRQPELDANHSPPSSVAVKNAWSYSSPPHTPAWPALLSAETSLDFHHPFVRGVKGPR
jgi:hypothetical protein